MTKHVVIVGGGVAGCASAILLRQSGVTVTLLEKRKRPSFTIGESISPAAVSVLIKLGIGVRELDQHFQRKLGSHVYYGSERAIFNAANSVADRNWPRHSYNVERKRFDQLLLKQAELVGVKIVRGVQVLSIDNHLNKINGIRDKVEESWAYDTLIDASGFQSPIVRQLNLRQYSEQDKSLALFAHYEGELDYSEISPFHLSAIILPPNSWIWVIPLSSTKVSIGLVDRSCSIDKKDFLAAVNKSKLNALLGDIEPSFIHGRVVADYHATRYCSEDTYFVGDSAFFVDPVFSSGVTAALKSAEYLVERVIPVNNSIQRMHLYNTFMQDYCLAIKRQVDLFYEAIKHPLMVKATLRWWNQLDNLPLMRQLQDWGNGAFNDHQLILGLWSSAGNKMGRLLTQFGL